MTMIPLEPYELMRMLHFVAKIKDHRDWNYCLKCGAQNKTSHYEVNEAIEELEKHLNVLVRVGKKIAEVRKEEEELHMQVTAELEPKE